MQAETYEDATLELANGKKGKIIRISFVSDPK